METSKPKDEESGSFEAKKPDGSYSENDLFVQRYFESKSKVAELGDLFTKAKCNPLLGKRETIEEKSERIIETLFYSEERISKLPK